MDWYLLVTASNGLFYVIYKLRDSVLGAESRSKSLACHFGTTKPKPLKSIENLGSKLTNRQMAEFPESFVTPSTLWGFSILLRSIVRFLQ